MTYSQLLFWFCCKLHFIVVLAYMPGFVRFPEIVPFTDYSSAYNWLELQPDVYGWQVRRADQMFVDDDAGFLKSALYNVDAQDACHFR